MAATEINGSILSSLNYTQSWGVSPASGTMVLPGDQTGAIAVEDETNFAFGATTFYGVVKKVELDNTDGLKTVCSLADNRVKLHEQYVACCFNMIEVIEDDISTPGIDRSKRYWHILPEDWPKQQRTYQDAPLSAHDILGYLSTAPTLAFSWIFDTHANQDKPVFSIDANNGSKLANVLAEISEKQGLVFTIVGENTLQWTQKGNDTLPTIPSNAFGRRAGTAASNCDTFVAMVGDRNRYQADSVTLEKNWVATWEAYWLEATWINQVNTIFGPFDADADGQASLFAKAKSVTVRQCVESSMGATFADYGKWGEVSRMEVPAWIYLQDIVYKAYQVPRSFAIGDSAWQSLKLEEQLLREMDYDPTTGALTYKDAGHDYPDTKALILAQGQQIGLIDPKYQKALTPTQIASAQALWSPVTRYSLDVKNMVVIFEEAVVTCGTGAGGLFLFPNVDLDATNMPDTHPSYNMAVPNAAAVVTAAPVVASLVFSVEKYTSNYGSGTRQGTHYAAGLRKDSLLVAGTFSEEVLYADSETADQKADDLAAGLILREAVYAEGGFSQRGAAGTALNGCIDRITITLDGNGVTEQVDYTKERSPNSFAHDRDLDRKQRAKELFPGAEKNRQEVWELHMISQIAHESKRTYRPPLRSMNDVMLSPVGSTDPGHQTVSDLDTVMGTVSGGQPIAIDKTTGHPVLTGGDIFAGVAIADGQTGQIYVATQGTVPVRVQGPVDAGDNVYWVSGQTYAAKASDGILVGAVAAAYAGTEVVLVPVQLAASSGTGLPGPFIVTKVAPPSGETDADGPWVEVSLNSWLMKSPKATDKVTITGLGAPLQLTTDAKQHIWLEVAIPLVTDSGGTITASIKHGTNWNPTGKTIYPDVVVYNTDTGTPNGSTPPPPSNTQQILLIIPIAYTVDPADDSFSTAAKFGLVLIAATDGAGGVTLVQQLTTNVILIQGCYLNQPNAYQAIPYWAPMPDDSGS